MEADCQYTFHLSLEIKSERHGALIIMQIKAVGYFGYTREAKLRSPIMNFAVSV